MTTPTVVVQSKPELQKALRATWRKDAVHVREQAVRFLRLCVAAAMPTLLPFITSGKFNKVTLLAFIVPVAEVAYRQMFPALGAKAVDEAQGATIVPEQVGADTPAVVPAPADEPADDDELVPNESLNLDDVPLDAGLHE